MNRENAGSMPRLRRRTARRAAAIVYIAVCMPIVIGMAALAVDIGMLYATQAEAQRTADAAALAAAEELLDDDRIRDGSYLDYLMESSRHIASDTAASNPLLHTPAVVDPYEDVDIGYVSSLRYGGGDMEIGGPSLPNAVAVRVTRDDSHGGSVALFFARFLGVDRRSLSAQAMAGFEDGIVGYEVTPTSGNAQLLPFALHQDAWAGLMSGLVTTGDDYSYDEETGQVSPGGDGIPELNLFPGAGCSQLPPGNFGTVDIGSSSGSTADLARQILHGISEEDLAYFGGRLELGEDGTLLLDGDTGLSAGVKDELETVKGQPRAIVIFSQVEGPGDNATFTVTGFVGIRIMNVRLTGKMSDKQLIVQPAVSVDRAALANAGPGPSHYVYRPVQLVR